MFCFSENSILFDKENSFLPQNIHMYVKFLKYFSPNCLVYIFSFTKLTYFHNC